MLVYRWSTEELFMTENLPVMFQLIWTFEICLSDKGDDISLVELMLPDFFFSPYDALSCNKFS